MTKTRPQHHTSRPALRTHYELLFVGEQRRVWLSPYFSTQEVLEECLPDIGSHDLEGYEIAQVVEDPEPIRCPTCDGRGTIPGRYD
ncbi:MAG: hypothetical protein KGJ23_08805 [Euryarchaeota archaeon]|nr:hypothetical protein [Euryarchaeota archaeon]MDE1836703.1 hypothetical protein [Euryarchaeota archaeon]MDE1880268.1 hypothetical protein [Euryarchaeota archaeon]MDE2044673.1 hypothetical protein [Thermoplasmata archaeon]